MIASKNKTETKVLKEHKALELVRSMKHNTEINVSTVLYNGKDSVELVIPELNPDQIIILGKFIKFFFPINKNDDSKILLKSRRDLTVLEIPSIHLDRWYEKRENEIINILLKRIKK